MKVNSLVYCKCRNYAFSILLALGFVGTIQAQSITVGGTVSGDDGTPLLGVTVLVKGTSNGTVTDFDGVYEITANTGDILTFSSIGFISSEIAIGTNKVINVTMAEEISTLDQVVVVGYGSQRRLEVSGAVSSVKGEEAQKFASNNFQDALQGKVAGVSIVASGGEPGSGAVIQIRGTNTLSSSRRGQGNDPNFNLLNPTVDGLSPLYIVDGVQVEGNPNISSNDIENIEVLKDAATTSIYGTRGAAGVIIITTKKGKKGNAKVDVTSYTGVKKITSRINLANTADAFLIDRTIHENNSPTLRYFSILDRNKNALQFDTNWQDFVVNDFAQLSNNNIRISGGGSSVDYNVSIDHYKEEGVYKRSDLERTNLRTNAGIKKGKFKATTITNLSTGNRRLAPWGLLYDAIRLAPFSQPFTIGQANVETPVGAVQPDGGVFVSANNQTGVLARKFAQDARRKEYTFGAAVNLSYQILDPLKVSVDISGYRTSTESDFYTPKQEVRNEETGEIIENQTRVAELSVYNTLYQSYNRNLNIDYDQYFGDHRLALLVGAESRILLWEEQRISVNTFASPEQRTITSAENITQRSFVSSPSTTNSFLSRLKYEYGSKYFLLGNIRRNGTSKFATGNKTSWFGGVSGAWIVSKEKFFENSNFLSFISNFKLRASWGTVGNDRVPDFGFQSQLLSNANPVFQGGPQFGATRLDIGNKDLQWETTKSTNYGVDVELFGGAFNLVADYYVADKSNLLFSLPTKPSAGVLQRSIDLNIAELRNEGLELALNYRHNKGAVKWSVGGTFTRNENLVQKLTGSSSDLIQGGFPLAAANNVVQTPVTFIRPGYSAGAFFLIPTTGVIKDQQELDEYNSIVTSRLGRENQIGDLRYVDQITEDLMMPQLDASGNPVLDADGNVVMIAGQDGILDSGDGVINDDDRIFFGNNLPDFETGINVDVQYKNFDFTMQWFGAFGHKVFNGPKNLAYAFGTHKDITYQYSVLNPNTSIPARRPNGTQDPNFSSISDRFIEDGDFIRLRNIQLGYTLPRDTFEKLGLQKFRVYVSAQNLLTITDYSGYDPEIGGDGLATRSVDTGQQPVTAQGILGLQVSF